MKVPGPDIDFRGHDAHVLLKEMHGHSGVCLFCPDGQGTVKMRRENEEPFRLIPNACWCLLCGQSYFMEISDLEAFDRDQWIEKQTMEDND